MTRPRVPDDKRLRIAQACGFCKTRKQKCDGQRPCSLCARKKNAENCVYDPAHRRHAATSTKRQRADGDTIMSSPPSKTGSPTSSCLDASTPLSNVSLATPSSGNGCVSRSSFSSEAYITVTPGKDLVYPTTSNETSPVTARALGAISSWQDLLVEGVNSWRDVRIPSHLYATERMLGLALPEGETTNLVGCSSHLAYLDALRNVLEVTGMPNPLRRPLDARFKLMELPTEVSHTFNMLPPLPDDLHMYHLIESFLVNTNGMIQVFEEEYTLDATVRRIIAEGRVKPDGSYDTRARVLLHLALAIGSVMGGPVADIHDIQLDPELYFQSVDYMIDNWTKDLWTVRVLILKALYALSVVRRNQGYEYIGRAGWLAQLLGMHREQQLLTPYDDIMKNGRPWTFNPKTGRLRRNVWRSLLVLDRFVAAQLGRPPVISDESAFPPPPPSGDVDLTAAGTDPGSNLGPAIRGVEVLSWILKGIYSRSETTAIAAAEIASRDHAWPYMNEADGDGAFAWLSCTPPAQPTTTAEAQRLAVYAIHARLLQLHSVILLGRPFVLFDAYVSGYETHPLAGGGDVFPRDCIEASYKSITLVWEAMEEGRLSRRNPFILYFIVTAALVVLSQEISSDTWKSSPDPILRGDGQAVIMQKAMDLFVFWSESDPQGAHLMGILKYLCSKCKNPLLSSLSRAGEPLVPPPNDTLMFSDSPPESVGSVFRTHLASPPLIEPGQYLAV